jgi:hypothetical protein
MLYADQVVSFNGGRALCTTADGRMAVVPTLSLDVRRGTGLVWSWAPLLPRGDYCRYFNVPPLSLEPKWKPALTDVRKIVIEDDTVHVCGHILDTIPYVSQNFSCDNFKDTILKAYDDLRPPTAYQILSVAQTFL